MVLSFESFAEPVGPAPMERSRAPGLDIITAEDSVCRWGGCRCPPG
jgi:hypothetical protein